MDSLAGLAYDERGAGEVVCLVHAGVFSAWFAPLFEQPALDGFRVIRPIRPGYGHTRGDGRRPPVDAVDAVRVHVVRETARAADPGDEHHLLEPDPKLRHEHLHRGDCRRANRRR